MKHESFQIRICPKCGERYSRVPYVSRADNKTLICPDCGTREVLGSMGVSREEQDKIIGTIHRSQKQSE